MLYKNSNRHDHCNASEEQNTKINKLSMGDLHCSHAKELNLLNTLGLYSVDKVYSNIAKSASTLVTFKHADLTVSYSSQQAFH